MGVKQVIQISAESPDSFGDAMRRGLEQARATCREISGVWIRDQKLMLQDGKLKGYRVELNVGCSFEAIQNSRSVWPKTDDGWPSYEYATLTTST